MNLAVNEKSSLSVKSIAMLSISELSNKIIRKNSRDFRERAHQSALNKRLKDFEKNPKNFKVAETLIAPPGSPIGASFQCSQMH